MTQEGGQRTVTISPVVPRGVAELTVPSTARGALSQHSGDRRAPGGDRAAPRCPRAARSPRCSGRATGQGRHTALGSALLSAQSPPWNSFLSFPARQRGEDGCRNGRAARHSPPPPPLRPVVPGLEERHQEEPAASWASPVAHRGQPVAERCPAPLQAPREGKGQVALLDPVAAPAGQTAGKSHAKMKGESHR